MKTNRSGDTNKQKGASLIEAAIGLSIFLISIFIYIDICWILYESMAWQYLVNRNIRDLTTGTRTAAEVLENIKSDYPKWLLTCPEGTCNLQITSSGITGAQIDSETENNQLKYAGFRVLKISKQHRGLVGRFVSVNIRAEAIGRIEPRNRQSILQQSGVIQ